MEEINVKNIEVLENVSDIATVKFNPNYAAIGNNYPAEKALIIKAIKSGAYVIKDDCVECTIGGEIIKCSKDIILVIYEAKDGLAVASSQEIVVSLDLTITDELKDEGSAREIIRSIQDARKRIGCEITDTVLISYLEGQAPKNWIDHICSETLSSIGTAEEYDTVITVNDEIKIGIKK